MQLEINKKTDPSSIRQKFDELPIKIHCCRYWKFSRWKTKDLTAPFWRLYHNEIPGTQLHINNEIIELLHHNIYLIPPNTPFSISTNKNNIESEIVIGKRINAQDSIESIKRSNMIDHFFIHFNLGVQHDSTSKQLFAIPISDFENEILLSIKEHLSEINEYIPFNIMIKIYELIIHTIGQIKQHEWIPIAYDKRIAHIIKTIQSKINEPILNSTLALEANMATNSFSRLFKQQVGLSVQKYITKKRLEKAVLLLHHSNLKCDTIAYECGFYDLHHFSKVFKRELNVSPSIYKKRNTIY